MKLIMPIARQIAPPFLLLSLFTVNGSGLWFLLWIPTVALLYSIIRLCYLVITRNKKVNENTNLQFIRPILSSIISILLIVITVFSFQQASEQSFKLALKLQQACNEHQQCLAHLSEAIPLYGDHQNRASLGDVKSYPVFYDTDRKTFELTLQRMPDSNVVFAGGVGLELTQQ